MPKYNLQTVNGYDLFICSSAMQKSIRRGDEKGALFWAVELSESRFGEYVWKRLKAITSEDIGLADPTLPAVIHALYEFYKDQVKKSTGAKHPERLYLVHAVLLLCRAKKSKLIDWVQFAAYLGHNHELIEVPDYAYDKHTQKGRSLGRGWDFYFGEGARFENMADIPGEAEAKEAARKYVAKYESKYEEKNGSASEDSADAEVV